MFDDLGYTHDLETPHLRVLYPDVASPHHYMSFYGLPPAPQHKCRHCHSSPVLLQPAGLSILVFERNVFESCPKVIELK
jgi:hypothetical protein